MRGGRHYCCDGLLPLSVAMGSVEIISSMLMLPLFNEQFGQSVSLRQFEELRYIACVYVQPTMYDEGTKK